MVDNEDADVPYDRLLIRRHQLQTESHQHIDKLLALKHRLSLITMLLTKLSLETRQSDTINVTKREVAIM